MIFISSFDPTGRNGTDIETLSSSCFTFVWRNNDLEHLNCSPHSQQTYGFSPECDNICLFKIESKENFLSHISQAYGLTSCWVFIWPRKSPAELNCLLHCLQQTRLFSRDFLWTFKWVFRWSDRVNLLLHCKHSYGFSPVWLRTWIFNTLLHSWQTNGFFSGMYLFHMAVQIFQIGKVSTTLITYEIFHFDTVIPIRWIISEVSFETRMSFQMRF